MAVRSAAWCEKVLYNVKWGAVKYDVTNPIKPAKLAAAFCHSLIHYHQILPALAIEEPPCFAQSARNQAPIQPEAEDCGAIVKCPAWLYDLRIKDSDSAEVKARTSRRGAARLTRPPACGALLKII